MASLFAALVLLLAVAEMITPAERYDGLVNRHETEKRKLKSLQKETRLQWICKLHIFLLPAVQQIAVI